VEVGVQVAGNTRGVYVAVGVGVKVGIGGNGFTGRLGSARRIKTYDEIQQVPRSIRMVKMFQMGASDNLPDATFVFLILSFAMCDPIIRSEY